MKEGWKYKKLKENARVQNGFAFDSKLFNEEGAGMPLIRIRDIKRGFTYTYTTENCPEDFHIKDEDLLIGMDGDFNVCSWSGGKALLNQRVCHVIPNDKLLSKFLYYFLPFPLLKINKKTAYSTVKHLSSKTVNDIDVPFLPLSEQERIVERLDAAFAQIDELKSNAEKQLAEARALFQSALTQAMQSKPGWQEIAFKDICSFVRGPFGGSLKKECFKESGYAVYEQQNAIYNKFSFRYFIDEEKYESMKRFSVNPGDLIMSCSGTIGKVAIIPDDAKQGIINQALLKLTPSKKINKYYLKYLMESELFKELIRFYSDGAAIQNIASVSILKEILLRIPSVSEQQRIVEYNDSLTTSFNEIEDNYKQTAAECDAMKQALLRQIFE